MIVRMAVVVAVAAAFAFGALSNRGGQSWHAKDTSRFNDRWKTSTCTTDAECERFEWLSESLERFGAEQAKRREN